MNSRLVSIEDGTWYYFTVDLDRQGFGAFTFERFIEANDRRAALVRFCERTYFSLQRVVLLPYSRDADYFRCHETEILSVWTFDGSGVGKSKSIDLAAGWPNNILDKAAITPSPNTAANWGTRSNLPLNPDAPTSGAPVS